MASLMVHRYLPALRNSPFILWQTVGITTALGWLLSFCIVMGLRCLMDRDTDFIAYALASAPYAALAKYVSAGLACNVLFGSAMMTASRNEVSTAAR